ncbi:MAG TPA: spore maturation protein [Candidatus Barnesiella excrementipullorum]|uniref:Spore maturation protein n=1 Tax=Candidatus Barnesiella excrementipullorum TaxID=2838479 RepID=A0A9D1VQ33_9BACT|nr:spore maturation protein [Candidatus Barnesiella excrementipullorum]
MAFAVAVCQSLFAGNYGIWSEIMNASFDAAKNAFDISLGLTGVLALWLGLMKVGERAGLVAAFARLMSPLFSRLFPGIPKGHPALGSMFMNISANMLGLDNAATPLGLKAMQEMQELNPKKDTATDAMLMFLILNASGLTLIPIGVMTYRAQMGAANPSDIFLPILLSTFIATFVALVAVCIRQRINIFDKVLIGWGAGFVLAIGGLMYFLSQLSQEEVARISSVFSNALLFTIIVAFVGVGLYKRINVYESFIEGAKDGFKTAITIIPYLVAILVGIAVFRASGAMDFVVDGVRYVVAACGLDTSFVEALPTALMKPLSGSGSRGLMVDCMATYGVDSFVAKVAASIQGSTDTTFYILAVYFGSVGIRKTRYAVGYALLADVIGTISGIVMAYFFFG